MRHVSTATFTLAASAMTVSKCIPSIVVLTANNYEVQRNDNPVCGYFPKGLRGDVAMRSLTIEIDYAVEYMGNNVNLR